MERSINWKVEFKRNEVVVVGKPVPQRIKPSHALELADQIIAAVFPGEVGKEGESGEHAGHDVKAAKGKGKGKPEAR